MAPFEPKRNVETLLAWRRRRPWPTLAMSVDGSRRRSHWRPLARSQAIAGQQKQPETSRVKLSILSILIVTISLKVAAAEQQVGVQASQSEQVSQQAADTSDEVNLIKTQNQSQTAAHQRPLSHVYRLRTGPMNGRLTLINNNSNSNNTNCQEEDELDGHQLEAMSPSLRLINSGLATSSRLLKQLEEPTREKSLGEQSKQTIDLNGNKGPTNLQPSPSPSPPLGDFILSLIDDYDSKIVTNRTKAQLSCDSGEMVLRLNFSDPFKGIVYPDHNRLSPCRFFGDGHQNYELRLPLRGCGTRQVSPRVFVNDVIVRFHKTLELEEDEVKTLICRYPPPLAPAPIDGLPLSESKPSDQIYGQPEQHEDDVKSQFELINGGSGPSNSIVETQSDNLVVAPNGGATTSQRPDLLHPRHSGNLLLMEPPQQARPGGGGLVSPSATSTSANLLERLSSIELLFLTSALMFLVLLALALATSYYCFRRQKARGSKRRASAILGARRLARSPLVAAATGAMPAHHHHHHHQRHQPYYTGQQPILYHSQQQLHQQHSQPSSPESDMSGRGLLATSLSLGADKGYLNAAYAPDLPNPYANSTVYGRRDHHTASAHGGRRSAGGGHYSARQRPGTAHQPHLLSVPHYASGSHQAAHLMRAKSLSSVEHQHQQRQQQHRQQHLGQHHHHRLHQHHAWPSSGGQLDTIDDTDIRQLQHKQSNYRKRQRRLEQVAASQVHTFSSESDDLGEENKALDPNTGKTSASILRAQKPKIVLKSIEDSYVTNLTEIHQQEYIKRDSTRPLSLAKWRSIQPTRLGGTKQPDDFTWSPNLSPVPPAPLATTTDQTLSPDPSKQYNTVESRYANLRSLTELDVDFAKPSLHPDPVGATATRSKLRPTASMGHLAGSEYDDGKGERDDVGDDEDEREDGTYQASYSRRPIKDSTFGTDSAKKNTTGQSLARQRRWSSSVPSIIVPDIDDQYNGQRQQVTTASESPFQPQSPDLILSPDYDLTTTRLELEPTNSSHNSVSYV